MIFIRTLIPDPLLISYAAILTYSIVCTMLITPLVRKFALRTNFVDTPAPRRVHENVIPNIGGVAFVISFLSALILSSFFNAQFEFLFTLRFLALASATIVIIVAGLYDDAKGLNFIQKFGIQVLVGFILFEGGFRIETIPTIFSTPIDLGYFALPVTILWISALCNAINLIDGLDGLAAGLVSIASSLIFLLSILQHDYIGGLMSLILAGVTVAFLYYNFYPAKIFMGDTGSLFLGLVLSCIMIHKIEFAQSSNQIISLTLILGIPVFDMALTIIRRALRHRHLFRADRLHVHHRLIDMLGMSHKKAVLTLYGWSFCFGFIGCIVTFGGQNIILAGCAIILFILGYATTKLRYFSA